jgi:hypothetical protein
MLVLFVLILGFQATVSDRVNGLAVGKPLWHAGALPYLAGILAHPATLDGAPRFRTEPNPKP